MLNYGLLGNGYIAERHIQAIKDTNGKLKAVYSPKDHSTPMSVESELEFWSTVKQQNVDTIVVASPSHFHTKHILQALEHDCHVIVEKPTCLNLADWEKIYEQSLQSSKQVYTIFQLRYHPIFQEIQQIASTEKKAKIKLTYIGNRDENYFDSWKGNLQLSGGVLAAVGIHFFDLLVHHFGSIKEVAIEVNNEKLSKGFAQLEQATIDWSFEFIPTEERSVVTEREFTINGHSLALNQYAKDLHTVCYQEILEGRGIDLLQIKEVTKLLDQSLVS